MCVHLPNPPGPLAGPFAYKENANDQFEDKTQKPANNHQPPTIILFGVDEHDKPRAARFTGNGIQLLTKAAAAMKLKLCEATTTDLMEVAKQLPKGRLYSNGRGFVPYVRRDLYVKLIAACEPSTPRWIKRQTRGQPRVAARLAVDWRRAPGHRARNRQIRLVGGHRGGARGRYPDAEISRLPRLRTLRTARHGRGPDAAAIDLTKTPKHDRKQPTRRPLTSWREAALQSKIMTTHGLKIAFHRRSTGMNTKAMQIRALNDKLRSNPATGVVVITPGIAALGNEAVERIVKTIAIYDDFCHANDPHQEHDFGSFDVDGHTIFFKIEYYDKSLSMHSPDETDPSVTERIMTIMLADEY